MARNTPNLGQRVGQAVAGSRAVIAQGQGVAQLSDKGGGAGGLKVPPGNRAIVKPGKVTLNSQPVPPGTPR